MSSYQALSFVLSFWEAIEETDEAMSNEFTAYGDDFKAMAKDYAESVLDDSDDWSD